MTSIIYIEIQNTCGEEIPPPPFFVQCNFFSFIKKWYGVSPFVSDSGIFSKNLVVLKMAFFVFLFFNRLLSLSWRIASIPTPPNCCLGGWGGWGGLVSSSSLSLCASSRSAGSENLHTGHGRQFSPFTNCRVQWLQAGLCLQRPHTYMLRRSTFEQTGHLLSRTHAPGLPNLELRQFLAVHLNRR